MSYVALARSYRSATFDDVVGQEAVATTLKNAILSGRVHHGYLFTGTRGVGKTSMARILAKSLNCLSVSEPTVSPCGACDVCLRAAQGEDVDVVEIDAASNTGVDSIRELRGNAVLRPARARFKIYIIDEVHMLSTGAFNALLKTLEEPPRHVKFILATTEINKVPATIQSRCQRFDFCSINPVEIAKHLRRILDQEGIQAEDGVLARLSRLACGSMRDALSLLDKLLSFDSKNLTAKVAEQILPPPNDELAQAVIDAVGRRDPAGALAALDTALQSGRTVERFCDNLIEHVRTRMVLFICGKETQLVDLSDGMRQDLCESAKAFDAPTYVYMIALLEELRRSAKSSRAARALADAAIVRLALAEKFTDLTALIERIESGQISQPSPVRPAEQKGPAGAASHRPENLTTMAPPLRERVSETPKATMTVDNPVNASVREKALQDPLVAQVQESLKGAVVNVRRTSKGAPNPTPAAGLHSDVTRDSLFGSNP